MAWYKKNMLSKDLMSNVDKIVDENESPSEDPLMSNEDENQDDPFGFHNDDDIPFSRLLSNVTFWWAQPSHNDDANLNMPILDDSVEVPDAPPWIYMFQ